MHYCIHLITKTLPNEDEIQDIMLPFNKDEFYDGDSENKEYPEFLYDFYLIGGRYCGRLKLAMRNNDKIYNWEYYSFKEPREGRLFHCTLLKDIREHFPPYKREEDFYSYLGDGTFINVDGAKISDILNINELTCYGFITPDKKAYVREHWDGNNFIDNPNFDTEYKKVLSDYGDCFLTVLDIHD